MEVCKDACAINVYQAGNEGRLQMNMWRSCACSGPPRREFPVIASLLDLHSGQIPELGSKGQRQRRSNLVPDTQLDKFLDQLSSIDTMDRWYIVSSHTFCLIHSEKEACPRKCDGAATWSRILPDARNSTRSI